jgi:hypothetical protein
MILGFNVVKLGIIAKMLIGMVVGTHSAFGAKLTASSYSDGYSRGVKDACIWLFRLIIALNDT